MKNALEDSRRYVHPGGVVSGRNQIVRTDGAFDGDVAVLGVAVLARIVDQCPAQDPAHGGAQGPAPELSRQCAVENHLIPAFQLVPHRVEAGRFQRASHRLRSDEPELQHVAGRDVHVREPPAGRIARDKNNSLRADAHRAVRCTPLQQFGHTLQNATVGEERHEVQIVLPLQRVDHQRNAIRVLLPFELPLPIEDELAHRAFQEWLRLCLSSPRQFDAVHHLRVREVEVVHVRRDERFVSQEFGDVLDGVAHGEEMVGDGVTDAHRCTRSGTVVPCGDGSADP